MSLRRTKNRLWTCSSAAAVASVLSLSASAQESGTSEMSASSGSGNVLASGAWTTSVMLRGDASQARLNEKIPAPEVAEQSVLLDLNLSGKSEFSQLLRFQADLDLYARRSWNFKKRNLRTHAVETRQSGTEENPQYRLALNEIYLNGEQQATGFQYTIGKKRVLWGTGFAANPTDLLNPAKNPLDPTYERRGSWLVQGENVQENQTLALLIAPGVLEDKNTLPTEAFAYSDSSGKRVLHYLVGSRWYQLIGGADLNLMLFYDKRFKDENSGAWKGGASYSQIASALSKQLEIHGEVLVQQGSSRPKPSGESRLDSEELVLKGLLGLRVDFENESALVVEYLHQSDGDSIGDFQTRLQRGFAVAARGLSDAGSTMTAVQMKNTLFVNYQRYKLNEDAFLSWAAAHNLHDHSGYQGPILQWTPSQTLILTLSANSDYNLQENSGAQMTGIGRVRSNELNPSKSRIGLEIKSFF